MKKHTQDDIIRMRDKRKALTGINRLQITAKMVYIRNWHYTNRHGMVCNPFHGYSN